LGQNKLLECPPQFGLPSENIQTKVYRIISFPVVFYGCGTWFPIVTEEHELRLFKRKGLRKTFRPQIWRMEEIT
jgi:hypothetical protein